MSTVQRAIKSGRLDESISVNDRGQKQIRDIALADQEWRENTRRRGNAPGPELSEYASGVESSLEGWAHDSKRDVLLDLFAANAMANELMFLLLSRGVTDAEIGAHFKTLEGIELPDSTEQMLSFCVQAATEAIEER